MFYRVLKPFVYNLRDGNKAEALPGQLVDIVNRFEVNKALREGFIGIKEESAIARSGAKAPAAPAGTRTLRVGIWMLTTPHYSGGRILIYQYAWTLAELGAEVFIVTNGHPRWAADYPANGRIKIITNGEGIPEDLDIVVSDSKGGLTPKALDYTKETPWAPFVCWNFETANWVSEFIAEYAARMAEQQDPKVYRAADMLISCSAEGARYLEKWLKENGINPPRMPVVIPAANTAALAASETCVVKIPDRPYAVCSSRGANYKCIDALVRAIWGFEFPFDLVVFGKISAPPPTTGLHAIHHLDGAPDAEKYALMKGAKMVLAPSKFEGFGMVPGEALVSGTPCIVYDLPVLRQNYGDRLIYVPLGDEAVLTKTIREVAEAPKRDVAAGRDWAKDHLSLAAMKRRVAALPFHRINRPSVTAQMILYYGAGTVREALESVYDHVDQILIAYGRVKAFGKLPPDGSLDIVRAFPDPDNKIQIEARDTWDDKRAMRTWAAEHAEGSRMLVVDSDEIYEGLDRLIAADPFSGCPPWVHFWHSADHWITDAPGSPLRWGQPMEPFGAIAAHYRYSHWRPSYYFKSHAYPADRAGNYLASLAINKAAAAAVPGAMIYHFGHCLPPATMGGKHKFYLNRDGANAARLQRRKSWERWNGKEGDCGDGIIRRVDWELPPLVKRAAERIKSMKGVLV